MIGFAFAATTLNYVHRLLFTHLSTPPDLLAVFSDTAFGTLGTAFFAAYTLSNGVSGFAIDRLGTPGKNRTHFHAYYANWPSSRDALTDG